MPPLTCFPELWCCCFINYEHPHCCYPSCGSACCSLQYVLQCCCIISPHIFSSEVTEPACSWKMVFVRMWSKCTAQHRMTASKSALQLLCFFEKGLSQLLQICWCFFISIKQARAPELFLSPSAPAFPAHLAESLLERFPLCLKACWHSERGHCSKVLTGGQNSAQPWNVVVSDPFLFNRYELFLINSFQKGERKAKFVWS